MAICKVPGCGARATYAELCSSHALAHLRAAGVRARPQSEASRLRHVLRQRAAGLGIALDDRVHEPEHVYVGARRPSKPRSPVF